MQWDSRIQSLLINSFQKMLRFEERLEELRTMPYASDAPQAFIDLLFEVERHVYVRLIELNELFVQTDEDDQVTLEPLFDRIRALSKFLSELYSLLVPPLESSRTVRNPASVSLPVEHLAKALAPHSVVLLYPSPICNYSYFNILSKNFLKHPNYSDLFPPEQFDRYPDYFVLLAVPDVLRDDILSHAIVGHEIGHLVGEYYDIVESALRTDLRTADRVLHVERKALKTYFDEYVADIVAVNIFGPASFFGIIEFATSIIDLVVTTASHPPVILRVKNMLDAMKEYGQRQFFSRNNSEISLKVNELLRAWEHLAEQEYKRLKRSTSGDVYDILKPALDRAIVLVKENVPERFQLRLDKRIFEFVVGMIDKGIPPSSEMVENVCTPVEFNTILNASWLYKIWRFLERQQISSLDDADSYGVKLKDLTRLTQKAVEQSETISWYLSE